MNENMFSKMLGNPFGCALFFDQRRPLCPRSMGKGWTDAQRAIITQETQELEHSGNTFSDGTPNKARAFAD